MTDEHLAFTVEHLRALHDVGKIVMASLDLDTTLNAIVEAAHHLTRTDLLAILLLDDPEHLVIRVGRGDVATATGERVRADEGVVGRALRERRPILIEDMRVEDGRARPDLDARSGLRTYLAVPLIWHGRTLGAVTVGATEPNALDSVQAALICELAEQAAAAVAHAHEYAREQARREEVEIVYRNLAERSAVVERVQQQLVQNEKVAAIGQLAHGIAHELNTPLGVIVSNLSVLGRYADTLAGLTLVTKEAADHLQAGQPAMPVADRLTASLRAADLEYLLDDLPQLLSETAGSADRIAAIVRSVATFARREADHMSPVDLLEVLESAVTLAWNQLKHRGDVQRVFSSVPPVVGHPSELAQLFVHLLLNAAQALEEQHGTVTIATHCDDTHVVVTIADSGRGIPSEKLGRVFDPFFTTRQPGQGTGMGLAVCHGIVTRHGGTIQLESEPGRGTKVTVRLPAAAGARLAA